MSLVALTIKHGERVDEGGVYVYVCVCGAIVWLYFFN